MQFVRGGTRSEWWLPMLPRDGSTAVSVLLLVVATTFAGAAAGYVDPTSGFVTVALTAAQLPVQSPYDVPLDQRYEVLHNGERRMWVYCSDKPHSAASHTKPRTEIRMKNYSSGVWQFEGYAYVPAGTTGVSITCRCSAPAGGETTVATTLMLHVYDGALRYYSRQLVEDNIYDRWFRLNVVHDVTGGVGTVTMFVDGHEKLRVSGRGGRTHYFKFGVYAQRNSSHMMESWWRDVRLFTVPSAY